MKTVFKISKSCSFAYLSGGRVIQILKVHGTNRWYVSLWENQTEHGRIHTTITTFNEVWHGKVGSRFFNCALPVGDERSDALTAHIIAQKREILQTLNEHVTSVMDGVWDGTEIILEGVQPVFSGETVEVAK